MCCRDFGSPTLRQQMNVWALTIIITVVVTAGAVIALVLADRN